MIILFTLAFISYYSKGGLLQIFFKKSIWHCRRVQNKKINQHRQIKFAGWEWGCCNKMSFYIMQPKYIVHSRWITL